MLRTFFMLLMVEVGIRNYQDKLLRDYADKINFKLELDPSTLQEVITTGNPGKGIAGVNVRNGVEGDPKRFGDFYEPFDYIYGKYEGSLEFFICNHTRLGSDGQTTMEYIYGAAECSRVVEQEGVSPDRVRCLYKKTTQHGQETIFPSIVRLKLIYYILEGSKHDGGCGLSMAKYISHKQIAAFFPLHHASIARELQEKCCSPLVAPWKMPFKELREYFGERFTLFYL
jgi:hypothetical protein